MPYDGLPPGYESWRTASPPEPRLSSESCDHCGERFHIGEEALVTNRGEYLHAGECFAEWAYERLIDRKETME